MIKFPLNNHPSNQLSEREFNYDKEVTQSARSILYYTINHGFELYFSSSNVQKKEKKKREFN